MPAKKTTKVDKLEGKTGSTKVTKLNGKITKAFHPILDEIIESSKSDDLEQLREYVDIFQTSSQEEVNALLAEFEDTYYNKIPLISDEHYELFVKYYESRFNQRYERIIAVPETDKFTLPHYLGSLDKIKTDKELKNWVNKYNAKKAVDVVIMEKLDGMSSLLVVKDGKASLYTQGNHIVGRDISHLLMYIKITIPEVDATIRGELVIPKEDFERQKVKELKGDGKNKFDSARAMIAGLINSKKHFDANKARLVKFVAYRQFTVKVIKKSSQLQKIEKMGLKTPWNCCYNLDNLTVAVLTQLVADRKQESEFEIDGLVLAIDQVIPYPPDEDQKDPKHVMAFKADTPEAETTVLKVEWNCSRHGLFKPRIFIEPVFLSGANLGKATLHDANHVVEMGINVGSKVIITRGNEVIPYVKSTTLRMKPAYPPGKEGRDWEWDETHVNIRQIRKEKDGIVIGSEDSDENDENDENDNEDNEQANAFREQSEIKKVYAFFKHIDASNLGEKTVAKLYKGGLTTVSAIIDATVADICKLDGFQKKGATNIVEGIIKAINDSNLLSIMVASGAFGMGLGARKIEPILEKHPDIILNPLPLKELIGSIIEIDGFQKKTATRFAENLEHFMAFLKTVPKIHARLIKESKEAMEQKRAQCADGKDEEDGDEKESVKPLTGKLICMSGFRDKELMKHLVALGGKETSSLSKKNASNTILVMKIVGKNSTKEMTAEELEIPVMGLEEFLREYEIWSFLDKYGFDE